MTLLDANILVYTYNREAEQHAAIKEWIDDLLRGGDWVGLPWISLWAFVRIMTNSRLFARPLTAADALKVVRHWIAMPNVVVVEPGRRHVELLEQTIEDARVVGPLVTDAVLAALAIEHGAALASTDRGFSRFRGLRWINPLDVRS